MKLAIFFMFPDPVPLVPDPNPCSNMFPDPVLLVPDPDPCRQSWPTQSCGLATLPPSESPSFHPTGWHTLVIILVFFVYLSFCLCFYLSFCPCVYSHCSTQQPDTHWISNRSIKSLSSSTCLALRSFSIMSWQLPCCASRRLSLRVGWATGLEIFNAPKLKIWFSGEPRVQRWRLFWQSVLGSFLTLGHLGKWCYAGGWGIWVASKDSVRQNNLTICPQNLVSLFPADNLVIFCHISHRSTFLSPVSHINVWSHLSQINLMALAPGAHTCSFKVKTL